MRHPKYFYHRSSLVSQKEEADAVESVAALEVVDCCIAEEVCTDPSEGSKRRLLLAWSGLVFLEVVLWRIRCNLWNSYHPDSHRMPTGLSVAREARSPRGVHGRTLSFVLEGTGKGRCRSSSCRLGRVMDSRFPTRNYILDPDCLDFYPRDSVLAWGLSLELL